MLNTTVTLALEGDVPLGPFADALDGFRRLIDALSKEVAADVKIEWIVDSLEVGSAMATARGESEAPQAVENVAAAYLAVGEAEARHAPIPYRRSVKQAVSLITRVLDGKIRAIRFETADGEATIQTPEAKGAPGPPPVSAYGAVTGRVQTLSSRGSLRFHLYDLVHDKAVSCYLEPGYEETMRGVWGKLATVEGWMTRDAVTGRPLSVRRITNVEPRREVEPGSFRLAREAVRVGPQAERPEVIIRRMRDGW
jgi:hypothetical protein